MGLSGFQVCWTDMGEAMGNIGSPKSLVPCSLGEFERVRHRAMRGSEHELVNGL